MNSERKIDEIGVCPDCLNTIELTDGWVVDEDCIYKDVVCEDCGLRFRMVYPFAEGYTLVPQQEGAVKS